MFLIRSRLMSKDSVKISFDTESVSLGTCLSFDIVKLSFDTITISFDFVSANRVDKPPVTFLQLIRYSRSSVFFASDIESPQPDQVQFKNYFLHSHDSIGRVNCLIYLDSYQRINVTRAPAILFYRLATIIWT